MNMDSIQWAGLKGHQRTDEERLLALRWCVKNRVVVDFSRNHLRVRLPGRRSPLIAYDLADAVKAAVENYGMSE